MAKKLKGKALEEFKRNLKIRPFEDKDAQACNDLYNEVFGQNRTMEQWNWLYKERPRGGFALFVAELDGEIIGQYPVVFTAYKCGDIEIMAGDHIDAAMKAQYRGTGIYSKMGNMAHEYYDPDLGMGFPTPLYYRFGAKTLGYTGVATVPRWLKVLKSEGMMGRVVPTVFLGRLAGAASRPLKSLIFSPKEDVRLEGTRIERVDQFDERVDALWEKVKGDRRILAVRDSAFLNYRFARSPFNKFDLFLLLREDEVIGYVVGLVSVLKKSRRGVLADMLVIRDPDAEKAAIGHIVEYFRGVSVDYVTTLILDRYFTGHLKNLGFVRIPSPAFLAFKNFKPEKLSTRDLADPNSWYISSADADWV